MPLRDVWSMLTGGGRPLSLGLGGAAAAPRAQLAAGSVSTPPPALTQATPDVPRRGVYRGRQVETAGIAPGVTPAKITAALNEAQAGYPMTFQQLLQEVTDRDYQIVSCLGTRKRAVAQRSWTVKPASDKAKDRRIAEWCERVLRTRTADLESGMVDLLGAIEGGYAASEIDWQMESFEGKVCAIPRQLLYCPGWWFKPSPENPRAFHLLDRENLMDGVPLWANRWVVHVAKAKPGFPVQAALGRVLLWYWLFKHYGIKDWAAYSELYGTPMRTAEAPQGASGEQIDEMEACLAALGVNSYTVLPAGWKIDFPGDKNGKSGPDVYERLVDLCDRALAKLILGQTLTTEPGKSGSYALGQVHNDVRFDLVKADAKQLASTLTEQLLRPLVAFNHGADVAVPTFEFQVEPAKDAVKVAQGQSARADVFKKAGDLGITVSRAQVLAELDLREPAGPADVLERPAAPAAADEDPVDDEDDDTDDDTAEEGDEE